MAANKKPKKKYVPRQVRYPSVVTQLNSFLPFEQALNKMLETGECEADSTGTLIFRDNVGNVQSFSTSLKIYHEIVDIYCKRNSLVCNLRPLNHLHNQLFEGIGVDEETVEECKPILEKCKQIIGSINPKELFNILEVVRIGIGMEKVSEKNLKNADNLLASIKHKVGDLTYEEVLEKNKYFQERVINGDTDERIVKLRDIYVEYLAAYNFAKGV